MKKLILLPLFLLLFSCEDAKVKAAKEKQADANCQLEHLQQHLALTNIMPMAIDLGLEKEYFEAIPISIIFDKPLLLLNLKTEYLK